MLVCLLALTACTLHPDYKPPNGVAAQLSLRVVADFDTAWQAVIETFAETTTSIETIEKASGFVAAQRPVDFTNGSHLPTWVDFGQLNGEWAAQRVQSSPHSWVEVRYNVLVVRGAAAQDVRVHTTWSGAVTLGLDTQRPIRVSLVGNSTGAFERRLLELIAARLRETQREIQVTQPFKVSTYAPPPRDSNQPSASPPSKAFKIGIIR